MPKLALQSHHIVDLYTWVDDILPVPDRSRGGRPSVLRNSEIVTVLIWDALTNHHKTLQDIYDWLEREQAHNFPKLPSYGQFDDHCLRLLPAMIWLLQQLLSSKAPVRLMDSTKLPVCRDHRAKRNKVAKDISGWGKNWQGFWFGLKLHASVDPWGRLCQIALTAADVHDAQAMPYILNIHAKVAVGDSTYGASKMRARIWRDYQTLIVAPPHYKQNKKLMTSWQQTLLSIRPKIETVFDYLKEHMGLISSFPRSVRGLVMHYVRILLAYQVAVS
jgi:Transposase DDE domain